MGIYQRVRKLFGDPGLFFAVLGLTLFGVVMIYSAGQVERQGALEANLWRTQLVWLVLSLIVFAIVLRIPVRWLEWVAPVAYFGGLATLLVTLTIGTGAGTAAGTKSWLAVGPIRVQPAQFVNVATILMLAKVMGGWRETPPTVWALWKPVVIAAVPTLLVLAQPDLGTAMVFGGVLLATLFWAGAPLGAIFLLLSPVVALFLAFMGWIYSVYMILLIVFLYLYRVRMSEAVAVLVANLASGTIAVGLWNSLEQYQRNRILAFMNPEMDPLGAGYHSIQSQIAIGSGGLRGKGFLEGTQKRLSFLPEQWTDFIYAVIGEELGFVGAVGVLLVYFFILWRLASIAERLGDPFAGIVVFGIFGAWFTHILVNVGMTVGVMPITGIPLPFLSYGGSFLLATFIGLGVAQRVAIEGGRV
ncbi:MAG: rod shape-determining protein RodA [Gemmatimonadota bacterium]